ncbi:DNA-binding protein [Polaromonas sp. P1(28)-13]|nr:DNA-binding protein [Polaromonas sp. P1(28)-13]
MQAKSTRGVQQDDVWAAADALIAEGLRPTIERVRLKIGRGSPNTVSPLLEAWFATLGPRLGVVVDAQAGAGKLPTLVQQAMGKLWDAALLTAREDAELRVAQAQQALEAERTALENRQAELASREQVVAERQTAIDEALRVARSQISDLTTRLEQADSLLSRRDADIDTLRSGLATLAQHRDAEQRRSHEEAGRHADERRRLEERAAASERRLLLQIDGERQKTKLANAALGELERRAEASRATLEAARKTLTDQLQAAEVDLGSMRQALASANERSLELRGLLEAQNASSTAALNQLNLLLAERARQTPAASTPRRRRT